MTDARLRELERKWRATGSTDDRLAYTTELKRTGMNEEVARIYQPILEEMPELRHEYLEASPLRQHEVQTLNSLLPHIKSSRIWHIGSSVLRTDYNDIDILIICPSLIRQDEMISRIKRALPDIAITCFIIEPLYYSGEYANLDGHIKVSDDKTEFDLCITPYSQFNDNRFRMRLR